MEQKKPREALLSAPGSAFPSDEKLSHWTMRNNSRNFDADLALQNYVQHEDQFNEADAEFLKSF